MPARRTGLFALLVACSLREWAARMLRTGSLMNFRTLPGAVLAIIFLAACSSSGSSQSTGSSGGGGGAGGSTSTGQGGSGGTTSTGTPTNYEDQVQARCTQFCDARDALAKTKKCIPENVQGCVQSCVGFAAEPAVKACPGQLLALLQCRTDSSTVSSCYCADTAMGDGTGALLCNGCTTEQNKLQLCSGL